MKRDSMRLEGCRSGRGVRVLLDGIALLSLVWACAVQAGEPITEINRADARRLGDPASYKLPTVVALWSLTCTHCKKHMQQVAELVRADDRLRLLTIAVEPLEPQHAQTLDRLGIPGERLAYGDEVAEALAHGLDPQWRGELPRTLYFDGRGGKQARSGVANAATVLELVGLAPKEAKEVQR